MQKYLFNILFLLLFSFSSIKGSENSKEFNPAETILTHIKDAHDFHILDIDGHSISLPLPIILYTKKGLIFFMSSAFHHNNDGTYIVKKKGLEFIKYKGKIYYAENNKNSFLSFNDKKEIKNSKPLDFSITKNVFSTFLSMILLLWIFISIAKTYNKIGIKKSPKGLASFLEPVISFVIYDVIKVNVGNKYLKYTPFLLTMFFFIWINNMIGLIPFFPFSANLTGNISFTFAMALFTLLFILFSGNKNYWAHIFATPGVPIWLYPIIIPIELIGIFTKPFALMVRLFANITAGHIVILSLVSLIFILKTLFVSPVSAMFLLFMNILELLVAFIQAYIFTMLSSMFIGQAVAEHH